MRFDLRELPRTLTVAAAIVGAASTAGAQSRPAAQPELLVSLDWLKSHAGDPKIAVLDIAGERTEFERGHIPNAGFVGHMETLGDQHRLLNPSDLAAVLARAGAADDTHIVLYGDDGMSVGWLYMALASIGHGGHTSVLDGNLQSWKKAGYPVATGASAAARGTLTARPVSDLVVDAPWVRDHLKDPAIALLDVRSEREWAGGMIPGATRIRWEDLYSDLPAGRFKPAPAIRELLERAGVTPGRTAVTYCAVGMRASLMYFAARLAGIPARVYQGSWSDWRTREGYPVAK
jgi:thiosulfate/3-mercaptopyruvate sulfurtransferase